MASSSSSSSSVPTFWGHGFAKWSLQMKDHLTSKGLWHLVENGYKKPEDQQMLNFEAINEFKQNRANDLEALMIIHDSLASSICLLISKSTTAKEAWDSLHEFFQINEPQQTSNEGRSAQPITRHTHFDVVLTKTAVESSCILRFPAQVASILPSNNIEAIVRCFSGDTYEISFVGEGRPKRLGAGWKRLVREQNLMEGDILRFELVKCSSNELELKIGVMRS